METSNGIFLTQLCLKRIMGADITPLITFDIIHLLHAVEGNMKMYSPKSIIYQEYDTRE
jgi:hypothetical protein